jgi:acetyltransferase-like isoleucine patch superfamily enzyme
MNYIICHLVLIIEKIMDFLKNSKCHYLSNSHATTKFYRTANVFNIQKEKACIQIDANSRIRGELLTFAHGGNYCFIGEYSKIWSGISITIGDRVFISHNVNIHDNNSHPIGKKERHEHFITLITKGHPRHANFNDKPIVIEDDVWIGFNSTIQKGVTIGKGSIIGANTFVNCNVPENVIFAGNPGTVIKKLS